jgi:SAM-dependent methyltransferase
MSESAHADEANAKIFNWLDGDYDRLLATCETDEVDRYVTKYFKRSAKLLESGCGTSRWVKYLHDKGYDICGLELSEETVAQVKSRWPELAVRQGDCEKAPFPDGSFDGIISLGVVEHWPEGPSKPLADMFRTLKVGGHAIITVPCLNSIRRMKSRLWLQEIRQAPRAVARMLLKRKLSKVFRLSAGYKFVVYPAVGSFLEYRMTPEQFRAELEQAGFEVIEHIGSSAMWGIYYEVNPFGLLVKNRDWQLQPTRLAQYLASLLSKRAFSYEHMQLAVVRKPS